jgi:hypothetical protein
MAKRAVAFVGCSPSLRRNYSNLTFEVPSFVHFDELQIKPKLLALSGV